MKSKTEKPPKSDLEILVAERLSLSQIGHRYGVSFSVVAHWLKSYGIKSKRHRGLNKGDKISPEGVARRPKLVGEKNGFFGKKHTPETCVKMSQNHADFSGDKNPYRLALIADPEKRVEASNRAKEMWASRDDEWRKAWAEQMSARPVSPYTGNGRNHKRGFHISSKITNSGGQMHYRSSWELDTALKLDSCDYVLTYEYEQVRIKFLNQNQENRWTYTDFLIDLGGAKLMIEVKPTSICMIKQDRISAQLKWCMDNSVQFAIIDKELIDNQFDKMISIAVIGGLDATRYDGRGPTTPSVCAEIIRAYK